MLQLCFNSSLWQSYRYPLLKPCLCLSTGAASSSQQCAAAHSATIVEAQGCTCRQTTVHLKICSCYPRDTCCCQLPLLLHLSFGFGKSTSFSSFLASKQAGFIDATVLTLQLYVDSFLSVAVKIIVANAQVRSVHRNGHFSLFSIIYWMSSFMVLPLELLSIKTQFDPICGMLS